MTTLNSAPAARATDLVSPLVPLGNQTFRVLWASSLVANFGTLIQGVGAAWLMTSLTGSADMIALVQASTSLPMMLLALAGGAIADGYNRKHVMLAAQWFMVVVSITMVTATYLGVVTPWVLLSMTFLLGCGNAINMPSWQASMGDLVARRELSAAITLNGIGANISRSLGPAIGGAVVAMFGAAAAFAANALCYSAMIVALMRWRPSYAKDELPREAMGTAVISGLRYVFLSPDMRRVLLRAFIFGLGSVVVLALLPFVASDRLAGDAALYGLLLGAFGVGAVLGGFAMGKLQRRMSDEAVVKLAFLVFAGAAWTLPLTTSVWVTALAAICAGGCWVIALSLFNVSIQVAAPRWVVGRALSVYQTASFGGLAIGSWIWGTIAHQFGLQFAFGGASALLIVGALAGFLIPLPPRNVSNLDPLNRWREPSLTTGIDPRSGPVIVEVAFIIRPEAQDEFLRIMVERRRIRRRDGARGWSLQRDLSDSNIWVERFHCATWTEYVRHSQRVTQADAPVSERLLSLHAGAEPPLVYRRIEHRTSRNRNHFIGSPDGLGTL